MSLDAELSGYSSPTVQKSKSLWTKDFTFDNDFIGFQGHFPGMPVLPAMIQLRMLHLLINEVMGPVESMEVTTAKFIAPSGPGDALTVSVKQQENKWSANIEVTSDTSSAVKIISEFKFKISSYEQK